MRVALKTLGCKLNQYETEAIREQFEARGYQVVGFEDQADVFVLNSCTVTKKADSDARRLMRRAKRRCPEALVVATGCYAQTDAEVVAALPEVDLVVGNAEKERLAELVEAAAGREVHVGDILTCTAFATSDARSFAEHTRAFLKIQDGCDARCAYCKVPLARGPNRSRPFEDAVARVARLCESGHREIVLIGVHLGTYGRDLDQRRTLTQLLEAILAHDRPERLRLSSVEPLEFDSELIDLLAARAPRLCRHLHIPLQSGSDRILRLMGRTYSADDYHGLVTTLAERIPELALGADVIVGFPGETDEDFARTLDLCLALPMAYLHVFSYSIREGTPAASMQNHVRPDIIKERCRELIGVSNRKRIAFLSGLVDTRQTVLIEREHEGSLEGLTDSYARVLIPLGAAEPNEFVDVEIERTDGERCWGRA